MKKNKGFTLLELMIVVAIIGIAASMVAPFFKGLSEDSASAEVVK